VSESVVTSWLCLSPFREKPVTGVVALLYSVVKGRELKLYIHRGVDSPANDPASLDNNMSMHSVAKKTEVGALIRLYE